MVAMASAGAQWRPGSGAVNVLASKSDPISPNFQPLFSLN